MTFEEAFENGDCDDCEMDPVTCEFCGYCANDTEPDEDSLIGVDNGE